MQNKVRIPLRERYIGDKVFYRQVVALVLPMLIQNTISNVVSLLDNVMVGQVGTLQMSAVAIVNQLMFVFNLCIFGGMSGAGIFATQFVGAKDDDGIRHCFRFNFLLGIFLVIAATLVFTVAPTPLISMYLAEGTAETDAVATMGYARDYLFVMLFGLLPFAVTQMYVSTLRSLGETRLPMIASVTAILVNLFGNWLLIFGNLGCPEMGVTGAAVATVVSRYVEMVIVVVYTHVHAKRFVFIQGAYKSMHIPRDLVMKIAKKGSPLLFNEFLWSAGMAMLSQCYSVRGLDVVAATNISSTISNLFNVVFMSMGTAVAVMVGTALGAGEFTEARKTASRLIVVTCGLALITEAALLLCAKSIPNIYNTESEVRKLATSFLRIVAVSMPIHAFAHCCYFTLRAGGKTIVTFFFDCVFTWVISFAVAFTLVHFTDLGIVPIYFIVTMCDLIKDIVGYILLKSGVWVNNIVEKEEEAA